MHVHRQDLNLLVIFDAVAQSGSVTKASQVLALSQPAVSHALNRLRATVGEPLFVRSHGRLVSTPRAERMRAQVSSLLESARAVLRDESFDAATANTSLRVGVSDYTVLTCFPTVVMAARHAAPLVRIDLNMVDGQMLERLESGAVDCSFWGTTPPTGPFESAHLFRDRFVGIVCRRHPLAQKLKSAAPISQHDYLAYPHAMVALSGTLPSPVDVALAQSGQVRSIKLSTPGFASVLSLLQGSDLIASIPAKLASLQRPQDFSTFELPLAVPPLAYSLVWHRRKAADPANAWFRSLLQRLLAD